MLLFIGMAMEEYMKFYLKMVKHIKLVWPKVKEPREVRKERLFVSFQRTTCELMSKGKS